MQVIGIFSLVCLVFFFFLPYSTAVKRPHIQLAHLHYAFVIVRFTCNIFLFLKNDVTFKFLFFPVVPLMNLET